MKKCLLIFLLLLTKTALSQLQDDFTDDNFTINPVWNGSNAGNDFIVVGKLLRSNSLVPNSNFYLTTASSIATNCRWEFLANLKFATSGSNYVDVYLTSDTANLQSSVISGYFIRIGNTDDEISLYKRTGSNTSSIKLIDGANGLVSSSTNNIIKVRVTRTTTGKFTLERDLTGTGEAYLSEGEAEDAEILTSRHFGLLIQQSTASFVQKHFFDDFRIEALKIDSIPPRLIGARAVDSLSIEVMFDEAPDSVSALAPAHYRLDPEHPVILVTPTEDPRVFKLTLAEPLTSNAYTLFAEQINDGAGNVMAGHNIATFDYRRPYEVRRNDIVINEIFADPSPQIDLPSVEYVELWNSTKEVISLKNWKYSDGSTSYSFLTDSIGAGEFLILCARADTAEFKKFGRVIGISPWPSLNNAGDQLTLLNDKNLVVSEAAYTDSWYQNLEKKSGGWSLERIDPQSKCPGITGWTASVSTSGGTPGAQNSVYVKDADSAEWKIDSVKITTDTTVSVFLNKPVDPLTLTTGKLISSAEVLRVTKFTVDVTLKQVKFIFDRKLMPETDYEAQMVVMGCDGGESTVITQFKTAPLPPPPPVRQDTSRIIITEIFADPSPEVGLPLAEFVEIYNPSTDTVDIGGWTLSDTTTKALLRKAVILPGEHVILCPAADTSQYQALGKTIGLAPWPSLNNSGEKIRLRSFTNRPVDSVSYSDSWYKDAVKKQGGWSLERIDPLSQCNGVTAWTASLNEKGGTPGTLNSVHNAGLEQLTLKADSIRRLTDTTVVLYLNRSIDPAALKTAMFKLSPETGTVRPTMDITLRQLKLLFSQKFLPATSYSLAISLDECNGSNSTIEGSFLIKPLPPPVPLRVDTAKIIITEIFADPSPEIGLPLAEFVEIHNPGRDTIDLSGWSLNDSGTRSVIRKGRIPPLGFLILCAAGDSSQFQAFGPTVGLTPWPSLNNKADQLTLKSFSSRLVDSVAFNDSWYKDSVKMQGGWSLEQVDLNALCKGKPNWAASRDQSGGTPGKVNSVFRQHTIPDPLKLQSATLMDSTTIRISFNQAPDSLSASDPANYHLNNGVGKPTSISWEAEHVVLLHFSGNITRNQNYTVTVSNLGNCAGTSISSVNSSAQFFYPKRMEKGDVVINEILFNPRTGGVDFVEIYNLSGSALDLKDLQLATLKEDSLVSIKPTSSFGRLWHSSEYLVLTADPENIQKEYPAARTTALTRMSSMPPFNDDEGIVVLLSEGRRIDQLKYHEKMHFGLIKDPQGVSLERSSFTRPTNDPGNFRSAAASAGFATPGYKNSQSLNEAPVNEELALLSQTFSPDNDGFEDILEMKYQFPETGWVANVSVYTDKGILIKKIVNNRTLSTEGVFQWDGLNEFEQKAPLGIYVLYVELFNTQGQVKKYRRSFALATRLD